MKTSVTAERLIEAPAEVLYHCIADYREHHRPDGFLPPNFTDFEIHRGGVGAGTEASWVVEVSGRRRTVHAVISEPDPGRTLVETAPGIQTIFTVERAGDATLVRFDTVVEATGLEGFLNRLFLRRVLVPVYEDELRRLDAYARAHVPDTGAIGFPRAVTPLRPAM